MSETKTTSYYACGGMFKIDDAEHFILLCPGANGLPYVCTSERQGLKLLSKSKGHVHLYRFDHKGNGVLHKEGAVTRPDAIEAPGKVKLQKDALNKFRIAAENPWKS